METININQLYDENKLLGNIINDIGTVLFNYSIKMFNDIIIENSIFCMSKYDGHFNRHNISIIEEKYILRKLYLSILDKLYELEL